MTHTLLREKIEAMKEELNAASARLDEALGTIEVKPRAEKTAISDVVKGAFEKLNAARAHLAELEALVADEEP